MRAATRFAVVVLVAPVSAVAAPLSASVASAQPTVVLAGQVTPGVELSRKNVVALFGEDTADSIKVKEPSLIGWTHNRKTYIVPGKLPLLAGDMLVAEISEDSSTGSASLKLWECGLNKSSGRYELTGESPVFTLYPGGKITSADTETAFEMVMASPEDLDPFMHLVVSGATPWWCSYALDIIVNNANASLTETGQHGFHYIVNAYQTHCLSSTSGVAGK